MKTYKGKTVFEGIAIGKIVEFQKSDKAVKRLHIVDVQAELDRLEEARQVAISQLGELYQEAVKKAGEANAAIIEIHQMMLEDDDYLNSITNIITSQLVNAEYAVATTGENFAMMFSSMADDYMKERAADVKDVSNRLINALINPDKPKNQLSEACIIVADDLAPSETLQLDREKVLAFVTRHGSANSHTAILARTMNIPALINTPVPYGVDGVSAIVDGAHGNLYISPDQATTDRFLEEQRFIREKSNLLQALKGKPSVTKSGKKVKIYANIGGVGDVASALQNDAEGIGLFRSEFLYLKETDFPSEEDQLRAYRTVAENMAGKNVIVRTLDIGADKQADYFNLEPEANPAMGYRAVRICLTRQDIFKTQLRALLRAGAYGNISIMIPMISSVWEIKKVKQIISETEEELRASQIPYKMAELGIMIETPASVMIADELAKEVDFFSIGTNDLTQYTLAVDRQNPKLEKFFDPHHPAVLRMIKMCAESAHKAGIWVGICGELGADLSLTQTFVDYSIDEISVSSPMILKLRQQILNCH